MSDTESVRQLLQELGLPEGDRHDLPTSSQRFTDGAHYRIEIPSVEGPAAMRAVIEAGQEWAIPVHRISQGSGITLLTDGEIREMVRLGHQHGIEVSLFVGPRAPWEGTAQALSPDGKLFGWRHTGMDQLAYAFSDVERATRLGIRGVLVADEGLILLINEARRRGLLPADLVMKGSAFLGAANPVGIRLLVERGLDTINVASDSTLAKLAALRQTVSIPIDIYIESPDSLGGFIRYHELSEIVRVAAPVYLKFGLRNAPSLYPTGAHLEQISIQTSRERVRRAAIGLEMLSRHRAHSRTSRSGAEGLGVPVPPRESLKGASTGKV